MNQSLQKRTIICDVEANGLIPTKIHLVVCKDVTTGEVYEFTEQSKFHAFGLSVGLWIGHNFIGYDLRALESCWNFRIDYRNVIDTLVLSRLTDATRAKHSIESWGETLGHPKKGADISDWSTYTAEMRERCLSDVEINYLLYKRFEKYLVSPIWKSALETEHFIAYHCEYSLHRNGFAFNFSEAEKLKTVIAKEQEELDKRLKAAFPPKVLLVRECTPKLTKHGTINKTSIPRSLGPDLSAFTADAPFSLIEYQEFNAGSHDQRIERLWEAGWKPTIKSKSHKDAEKALRSLKWRRGYNPTRKAEIALLEAKIEGYRHFGWKSTDEENLSTLPEDAPEQFKLLARFILLKNRVSTLTSWLEAYNHETGRVHGSFNHIEPWTQRMSHTRPNMGNIPKFDAKQPHKTPYSDKMRALWCAGPDRYLVGVDAESIQLRIFGHYINDKGFINALCAGKKEDQSDPHSLNQKALGSVCKSRDDAKTFIYAWLLGAGIAKVAAILGCSHAEAQAANDSFLEFYPGLKFLKDKIIPIDAVKGYFQGFDGRYVKIWGDDEDERRHFTLAGYLQNGESVIMKRAAQLWVPKLEKESIPFWWVNFVHDEFQIETVRDLDVARYVADTVADSIRQVGLDLNLNCPMAGSVLNGHGKLAVGDDWMETH